ncbi:hypothetical protein Tco_1400876 [Tanacetum coccineum]
MDSMLIFIIWSNCRLKCAALHKKVRFRPFLRFGYEVSFEALDKGAIEILGPYGISEPEQKKEIRSTCSPERNQDEQLHLTELKQQIQAILGSVDQVKDTYRGTRGLVRPIGQLF